MTSISLNQRPLWKHQEEAINRAKMLPHFGLFFEMGCGKSRTVIDILRSKMNEKRRFLKTIIFCPPIVVKNWKDEFKLYSKVDQSKIVLLTGSASKRLKLFLDNSIEGAIFVTNYETLLMRELYRSFQQWGVEACIFDESHRLKNHSAQRTKLAAELVSHRPLVYLLSGTPVLNTPLDIFSQFKVLDGGSAFGGNFYGFRARYFRDKNAGMPRDRYFPKWEIMPGALDEINRIIHANGMRVEKKDCLDLPPLVQQTIKVGMTPEQTRLYNSMKKEMVAYLEDKACVATLAITKALRLMQIASGYIKTEDEEVAIEQTPKMEALKELLSDLTDHTKVIVWAVWKKNYAEIKKVCEELKIEYVEVTGEISPAQKQKNVERFNKDKNCRVFLGNPGAGGIGINLIVAPIAIFYSRTFSLEHSLQAEARNYRGGSEMHEKVTRIDLVCENTIDELVMQKLQSKQEMSFDILKNIKIHEF